MSRKESLISPIWKKKKLTNNLGLKIISLLIAIGMWLIVLNITDPVTTQNFRNVSVKLVNTSAVTDLGKTYEVVDSSDVLSTVTIKAPRTVIQALGDSPDCITATADFNKLSEDGSYVPIEVHINKYVDKVESIRYSDDKLQVNIENRKVAIFPIVATTSGEIESGYVVGAIRTEHNQVKVSGPESKVSAIKKAVADVTVTGFTEDISTQADIILYDENDKPISNSSLSKNISNVKVDVSILVTKKIPVSYSYKGIPETGYGATGVTGKIETVLVAGHSAVLDKLDRIKVPDTEINVTGQSSDFETTVNLNYYLPSGVIFANPSFDGKASVMVYIEPLKTQKVTIPLDSIEIEGIPDGFEATWAEGKDYAECSIMALSQDMEKLSMSNLDYLVDFSDYANENDIDEYREGTYALSLNVNLPDNVTLEKPVTLKVSLKSLTASGTGKIK